MGQEEINNSERGMSREEGRISREAKGKQKEEKGSSLADSERESFSGKFLGETLSCAIGDVGWVEEVSIAGEMRQRSSQADDNRCNTQAERGSKPSSCHPSNPEEIAKKLGLEVEEGRDTRAGRKRWSGTEVMGQCEVTRLASSGRVQTYSSESQVQNNLESGRGYGSDSGSGSTDGSDLGTGRILSRSMGLGLDQMGPSPIEAYRSIPDVPILLDQKGYETKFVGGESGLQQGPILRLSMPSKGRISTSSESNIAEEGIKEISREEGEIREDLPQDDDCVHIERYVNKYNDQSPSSRFSVFGRPLLPRDFSGLGGTSGYEDLDLMRKEAIDDREWGRMPAGVIIADGEVAGIEGQRGEEKQQETTGDWMYDSWESSCLVKFSKFLGFPTKGFEKEILELLRNLVASLKKGKEKGNMAMTKSERELRRLKSSINYNGKQTNKGGGRDKGNPQIKL